MQILWFSLRIHSTIKKIKRDRAQLTLEMRLHLVFVLILMHFRLALSFQHVCVKEISMGLDLGPAYKTTPQRHLQRKHKMFLTYRSLP